VKVRRPVDDRVEGLPKGVEQRQEVPGLEAAEDLGHGRLGAAQQQAGPWPAAGGMIGHGREDGGADRVEKVDPAEVTDDRRRSLGEAFEERVLHLGDCGDGDLAGQGQHEAALPGGVRDLHPPPHMRPNRMIRDGGCEIIGRATQACRDR
jgi:hypothetical protein